MKIKRLTNFFILFVIALTASACAAKKEPVVQQKVAKVVTQVVEKEVQKVVAATVAPKNRPGEMAAAGQAQDAAQSSASGEVTLLNYQTGGVRMVIKDAEMELLVADTDRAIDQVTQLVADYGGYLISSQSWFDGEFKYAAIRLTVPAQAFETALTNLRHIGVKVMRETGSGQDVSAEYTDLQSRLTNLEATAARVREFLNAAQTVEESLKVNQQLSDLESQIEQIKGQMKYYEGRTAYSTITADLVPQRPTPTPSPTATPTATPTPKPGWNPANTFNNASGILAKLVRATIDLLIWLTVVFGPFVLILVVLVVVLDRLLHLRLRLQSTRRSTTSRPAEPANPENQVNP